MGWKPAPNKRRVAPFLQESDAENSGRRTLSSDMTTHLQQNLYRRRNAITYLCIPSNNVVQQVANTLRRLGDELATVERRASGTRIQRTNSNESNGVE